MADEENANTVKMPSEENKLAGSNQLQSKLVRIFTVFLYFGAVSGTAFMLSLYYIFIWDPEPNISSDKLVHDELGYVTSTTSLPTSSGPFYSALVDHYNVNGSSLAENVTQIAMTMLSNRTD